MSDTVEQSPEQTGAPPKAREEMTLEEKVLDCFVALFKRQLGFRRRAGANISFLEANRFNPKVKTYDVKVKVGMNDWRARRFTVGPIGEETGSKGKFTTIKLSLKFPPSRLLILMSTSKA